MKHIKYLFLITILLLSLYSCDKNEGPAGDTGPTLTGDITGTVSIYNDSLIKISDASGIKVSIENTTLNTTTDPLGKYTFMDVEIGTYNLTFEKDGYPSTRINNLFHMGGEIPAIVNNRSLYPTPDTRITHIEFQEGETFDQSEIIFLVDENPLNRRYRCIIYFNDNNDVSYDNYLEYSTNIGLYKPDYTSGKFYLSSLLSINPSFYYSSFLPGSTVYARVYVLTATWGYNSNYYDFTKGFEIFPTINKEGASEVISFIVPGDWYE